MPSNLILCPVAGYTDAALRAMAVEFGAAYAVTEMVSAKALTQNSRPTRDLLVCLPQEKIRAVQLFGHEPEVFLRVLDSGVLAAFDIIDINMGCPMPKIIKNGDGSALLSAPVTAAALIKAAKTSGKTVTVKMRTGISDSSGCENFAKLCEQSGADALMVHGRTQKMLYSGTVDLAAIGRAAKSVGIPVFGNGDVSCGADVSRMLELGCAGVGIGRAAPGAPYIFAQLLGREHHFDPCGAILRHISDLLTFLPDKVVCANMKKQIYCYIKGLHGYKSLNEKICAAKTCAEMRGRVEEFFASSEAACSICAN